MPGQKYHVRLSYQPWPESCVRDLGAIRLYVYGERHWILAPT